MSVGKLFPEPSRGSHSSGNGSSLPDFEETEASLQPAHTVQTRSLLDGLSFTKKACGTNLASPAEAVELDNANQLRVSRIACRSCGSLDLRDDRQGIRCHDCGKIAWLQSGKILTRVDHSNWLFNDEDQDRIPTCYGCGGICTTETLDGQWHCSRCDPAATMRFLKTQKVLSLVAKHRASG
jgi:hypothetical protein